MYTNILFVVDNPKTKKAWAAWLESNNKVKVGTWPALFNTKAHKVRKAVHDILTAEFVKLVQKTIGQKRFDLRNLGNMGYAVLWTPEDK